MLSSSMMALFAARPRLFVRGVQQEFQFRNGSGDPSQGVQIDGIFGPKTDGAVRGFQQALSARTFPRSSWTASSAP
jgi:peptidoglycan hydrolase-like protein with peptidoglycan-binding domain